jgi:5,10-methylenetetrahydromethanopterin reductase
MDATLRNLGLMYERDRRPEDLLSIARLAEDSGFDELWVVEDLGWGAGISAAAAALAVTERLIAGIGVTPAPLRNPALLAMELAQLERMFPGRLLPGIGHGVPAWMRNVGAAPKSALALLEETFTVVGRLLDGDRVDFDGRELHLADVALVHPPAARPPLLAGVSGPKSLELAGRVADGTIVVEGTGPDLLREVIGRIDVGRSAAGRTDHHRIVVFLGAHVTSDAAEADAVRDRAIRELFNNVPVGPDPFMAVGPVDAVDEAVRELWAAGADTVVLRPIVGEAPDATQALAAVAAGNGGR